MYKYGRPEYTDKQYERWLEDMSPFLKHGYSLYHAIDKASLSRHKDSIYRKYRLNDWFCEKIEAFQRYPGELVNSIFSRIMLVIDEKLKRGQHICNDDLQILKFFAEKHHSCRSFFGNKITLKQKRSENITQLLDLIEQSG